MVPLLVLLSNVLIRANEEKPRERRKSYAARGIECARSRPYIVRRADVILTDVEEVAKIRANAHRFGAIRTLVLVGFFPIGLLTSTAVPTLGDSSGTWAITGSMNTARDGGTATLLSNGQVLLCGPSARPSATRSPRQTRLATPPRSSRKIEDVVGFCLNKK